MEYLQRFGQFFLGQKNALSLLVYAIIILLFVIGFFRCVLPVMRTRGRLKRAIRSIKSGKRGQAWQENAFLGKGSLYPHWSEYLQNLFFADGVYHNASNVEDYINEETVIEGPGRAAFSEALPGLMVSLGFLGTLIGLAMGLSDFDMADSSAVQNSIVTLIPGMRYAFTTSIVGVIASVAFTLLSRFVDGSAEHTLQEFYGAMSRYAGVLSVDPMTQIAIYQQEQTALIQTMAQDLNGQLTDRMSESLENAMGPINESLTNFVRVTTEEQMRFLDRVVGRFVDRMDEVMQGQFKQLGQVMQESISAQSEATEQLRAGMRGVESSLRDLNQMQKLLDEMLSRMDRITSRLEAAQGQAEDGFVRVSSNLEQMELVSRQQIGYLKSVSAMHSEVTQDVEKLQSSVSAFADRIAKQNADAVTGLLKASGELRATGAALEAHRKEYSDQMDKEMAEAMNGFQAYMEDFTQRVDHITGTISASLERLPDAVSETAGHMLDEMQRLTSTVARAQRALDDAVDRLYGR